MEFKTIAFKVGNEMKFLTQNEVMYCKADHNYTEIILVTSKTILSSKSLKELESIFDEGHFYRINHSYIVNTNYIARYSTKDICEIEMKDGKKIIVSRRKRRGFLDMFKKI